MDKTELIKTLKLYIDHPLHYWREGYASVLGTAIELAEQLDVKECEIITGCCSKCMQNLELKEWVSYGLQEDYKPNYCPHCGCKIKRGV